MFYLHVVRPEQLHLIWFKTILIKNFFNSIKRFIARRGCPKNFVSDNGSVLRYKKPVVLCKKGITWKFNLNGLPLWGAFWKRLTGMVNSCLKKSIESEKLSFTELSTVLFEVENVMNNRPLCFVYGDDVSDALTSKCFLYVRNLDHRNKIKDEIDFGLIEGVTCGKENDAKYFWLVFYRE